MGVSSLAGGAQVTLVIGHSVKAAAPAGVRRVRRLLKAGEINSAVLASSSCVYLHHSTVPSDDEE